MNQWVKALFLIPSFPRFKLGRKKNRKRKGKKEKKKEGRKRKKEKGKKGERKKKEKRKKPMAPS